MTTYTLYWISEDGQSDIRMGAFNTRLDAWGSTLKAELEMIDQAADQEQRDSIVAGWWTVCENKEN